MFKFIKDNCTYNNADGFISVYQVAKYLNETDVIFDTINCINSCDNCHYAEDNTYPFELGEFYFVPSTEDYFTDIDKAVEEYENEEIYEIQIYYCENCQHWCIEYDLV